MEAFVRWGGGRRNNGGAAVGSSGLRIIKKGVELIIPKPLLIKNLLF